MLVCREVEEMKKGTVHVIQGIKDRKIKRRNARIKENFFGIIGAVIIVGILFAIAINVY